MKWYNSWPIGSLLSIPPFGNWFGTAGTILQVIGLTWLVICGFFKFKEYREISKKLESTFPNSRRQTQ